MHTVPGRKAHNGGKLRASYQLLMGEAKLNLQAWGEFCI